MSYLTTTIATNSSLIDLLSNDEINELQSLKEDYEKTRKTASLDEFKKLDPSMRQQVINIILWQDFCDKVNNLTISKPERLIELERRDIFRFNASSNYLSNIMPRDDYRTIAISPISLPNNISIDDLKQAHLDASLEEEITKQNNPK